MALIKCSECGKEVSASAATCPNCGNPVRQPEPPKKGGCLRLVGIAAIVFVGLVVLAAIINGPSRPTTQTATPAPEPTTTQTATPAPVPTTTQTPTPAPEPVPAITARALSQEYQANEVAADNKYKGKILEVTGKVESIGKDILDDPYVSLAGADMLSTIQFTFKASDNDQLAQLSKGQTVTIRGECRGLTLTIVSFRKSVIVK